MGRHYARALISNFISNWRTCADDHHASKILIHEAIVQIIIITIPNQDTVMEQENDTELITQESQPANKDITEPRKRKKYPTKRL